jgi:hypothetical protein
MFSLLLDLSGKPSANYSEKATTAVIDNRSEARVSRKVILFYCLPRGALNL